MVAKPVDDEYIPDSLFHDRKILCPWCDDWFPAETFTGLQVPPEEFDKLVAPITKHGGEGGCKRLFAPVELMPNYSSLQLAQDARAARGAQLEDSTIDAMIEQLCDAVQLSNADRVGPEKRKKLKGILAHYKGMKHPFTQCVKDNTKRFGPERAKKVCAVIKDINEGTTKWRKGPKKTKLSQDVEVCPIDDMDEETFELYELIGTVDYNSILFGQEA